MAKIQVRRGTKAQLETLTVGNYLDVGELGFTTDTEEVYVGTGLSSDLKHLIGKVMVDTFANRPTAGVSGRMYHASDTDVTYVDDGVAWIDVSSGIATIDDVADGTTYVRTKTGAVDSGYIVQLTDNTGANPLTKTTIDTHIGDATKHRIINDIGSSDTELWSASKIQDEIATVVSGIDPQDSVIGVEELTSTVTPVTGDRYIADGPGVAFDGSGITLTTNNIYEWDGIDWVETVANEGMFLWNEFFDSSYVNNGIGWVKFGSTVTHNNLAGLNLGDYVHLTAAEKTNFDNNIHIPVTVSDSTTINLTLTGQDVTASTIDGAIDHNALLNTHNLTTDINHASITGAHNLTTDINHNTITNGHNLTTDINHDLLTNFVSGEHFLQSAISITASQVSDFNTSVQSAITVSDTTSIDMTITGGAISAALLVADGGTFV